MSGTDYEVGHAAVFDWPESVPRESLDETWDMLFVRARTGSTGDSSASTTEDGFLYDFVIRTGLELRPNQ